MTNYRIQPEENITLGQVKNLTSEGNDITLTPHIGNIWRQNLAVSDLGVKIIPYESNCHIKDDAEFPGFLRLNNEMIPLTSEENPKMVTHFGLKSDFSNKYLERFELGSTPAQIHFRAMQKVFPKGQLYLFGEYFFTAEPIMQEMLLHLAAHHHIFTRKVSTQGLVEQVEKWKLEPTRLVEDFITLKREQIAAVMNGGQLEIGGPLTSNQLNVMLLAIKAFLEKRKKGALTKDEEKKFTAYAVSGRDMIHYTKNPHFQEEVSVMYEKLHSQFPFLPEEVTLKMLPGSNLRFCVLSEDEAHKIVRRIGTKFALIEEKQNRMRNLEGTEKKLAIGETNAIRDQVGALLKEYWELDPTEKFYSQHDALLNNSKPVIPEEVMGMTFKKIGVFSDKKNK